MYCERKRIALLPVCWALAVLVGSLVQAEITISEIDLANDQVEIVNAGTTTEDISSWWRCNRVNGLPFYSTLSSATIDVGFSTSGTSYASFAPGDILLFDSTGLLTDANGEFALYNTNSFGSATAMEDYILWGANGIRDFVAQNAGIWIDNDEIDVSGLVAGDTIQLGLGLPGDQASDYFIGPSTLGVAQSFAPTWNVDSSGDWNDPNNWSSGTVPNSADAVLVLGGVISSRRTVFTDSSVTALSITFDDANGYVIAGQGDVHLAANVGEANVNVITGQHDFQAPAILDSNTTLDLASGSSLEFVNRLNLNGNTLTKTGDGTLVVSNTLNTGGGTILNNSGVLAGSGTVGGSVENTTGTVAPGNSPGVLTIEGNYTQGSAATLAIEIAGTAAGTGHDQLDVNGASGPHDWTTADFDLDGDVTDFNSLANNFVPGGYGGSTGQIPEPTTIVLGMLGLVVVGMFVRGKRRSG